MAIVVFYEKPGCSNNSMQKQLLRESGHKVVEQNILTYNWTSEELLGFFVELPVTNWFNPSAPSIKYGKINPASLEPGRAIELMLADPLLIRRPLMQVNDTTMVGFDYDAVDRWIGLIKKATHGDIETCRKVMTGTGH